MLNAKHQTQFTYENEQRHQPNISFFPKWNTVLAVEHYNVGPQLLIEGSQRESLNQYDIVLRELKQKAMVVIQTSGVQGRSCIETWRQNNIKERADHCQKQNRRCVPKITFSPRHGRWRYNCWGRVPGACPPWRTSSTWRSWDHWWPPCECPRMTAVVPSTPSCCEPCKSPKGWGLHT